MGTGPQEGLSGATEEVKGAAKRAAGSVIGDEDLHREGEAQEEKADASREAAAKEAEAEKARGEATAREGEQRTHQ